MIECRATSGQHQYFALHSSGLRIVQGRRITRIPSQCWSTFVRPLTYGVPEDRGYSGYHFAPCSRRPRNELESTSGKLNQRLMTSPCEARRQGILQAKRLESLSLVETVAAVAKRGSKLFDSLTDATARISTGGSTGGVRVMRRDPSR